MSKFERGHKYFGTWACKARTLPELLLLCLESAQIGPVLYMNNLIDCVDKTWLLSKHAPFQAEQASRIFHSGHYKEQILIEKKCVCGGGGREMREAVFKNKELVVAQNSAISPFPLKCRF